MLRVSNESSYLFFLACFVVKYYPISGRLTLCLPNFIQNDEHLLKAYSFSSGYLDACIQSNITQRDLFSVRKYESILIEFHHSNMAHTVV